MTIISIGVDSAGFYRDRLDAIITKFQTRARTIYGVDTNLDAETSDGQFIGAFAEAVDDVAQAVEDVYNGRNPSAATGQNLTSTCTLNGVYRIIGDYAYVDVQMTIAAGAVVPAGTQVQDADTGATYASTVAVTGTGAGQLVTCKALVKGMTSAAGKVTIIVRPTYGLLSVTNPSPSTTVDPMESDEALRTRRALSTAAPTVGFLDSIRAGLLAVPGVGQVKLWENDTGATLDIKPGDHALASHSLAVVVTGGEASAIGAAIYARKPPGISTVGSASVAVNDLVAIPHVMRYTVATPVEYALKIQYWERPGAGFGAAGGEAAVKAALVAWSAANQPPSGDVYRFHLAAVAQQAVVGLDGLPAIVLADVQLGRTVGGLASADLALVWTELARLLTENIVMEVVA